LKGIRPSKGDVTVHRRRDVLFTSRADERNAATTARQFIADRFDWAFDRSFIDAAADLLGLSDHDPSNVRWRVERAVESGELVTIPDYPPTPERTGAVRSSGGGSHSSGGFPASRAKGFALTPSVLFKRVAKVAAGAAPVALPQVRKLTAADGLAIWAANPGDVLPDGSIAKALTAEPFEYVPHTLSAEAMELAAKTNNVDQAAKMLGYDRRAFRNMIHEFKPKNGLRPNDNVIFYDDGSVEFKQRILDDNIHNYAL
jgi:hypothetical protein